MSVSRDGKWAAFANRIGRSVTLFSIKGTEVKPVDTISVEGEAASVAFSANAKRLLVTKFAEHSVAIVDNDKGTLSYDVANGLPVGRWPYNVQVANRTIALLANNGNAGLPDGHVDTISVLALAKRPPRVVRHVVVGDGPEGLAICWTIVSRSSKWLMALLNRPEKPFRCQDMSCRSEHRSPDLSQSSIHAPHAVRPSPRGLTQRRMCRLPMDAAWGRLLSFLWLG